MFRIPLIGVSVRPKKILFISSTNWIRKYAQRIESTLPTTRNNKKITPLGWFLLLIPTTTFGLGCWQVKRKAWKEDLISQLENKIHTAPVNLPENLDDLLNMEYRSVIVKGKFLHDKELYMGPRSFIRPDGIQTQGGLFSQQDNTNGYLIITPFKLSKRGETILINRGWVPRNKLKPETRLEGQINKEIEIIGVVRRGENRPQFSPDHKGNIFLYRDLGRMCAETGSDPIILDANYSSSTQNGPIGGQTRVTLRNDHLSYLITWFSLSAATSYMWFNQIVKRKSF